MGRKESQTNLSIYLSIYLSTHALAHARARTHAPSTHPPTYLPTYLSGPSYRPAVHSFDRSFVRPSVFGNRISIKYSLRGVVTLENHCTRTAQSSLGVCSRRVHKIVYLAVKKGNILGNILLLKIQGGGLKYKC